MSTQRSPDEDEERLLARQELASAISRLARLSDESIGHVLGDGLLNSLVNTIAPARIEKGVSIYEHLRKHRSGLQLLALLRHAITMNYAFRGSVNDSTVYVSPHFLQWYQDGVMFIQSPERFFGGVMGLFIDGNVKFAVAARDIPDGGEVGPNDILFVDVGEAETLGERQSLHGPQFLDDAVAELEMLIESKAETEGRYQQYLQRYAFAFGAMYSEIQAHEKLDEHNIPDFSGVRLKDGARDIIEIKSPFLKLFRRDGSFSSEFNDSWNQAERYLRFARHQREYLERERGLRFEDPRCLLLIGQGLSRIEMRELERKAEMNPAITVWTYDDVLRIVKGTRNFLRQIGRAIVDNQVDRD